MVPYEEFDFDYEFEEREGFAVFPKGTTEVIIDGRKYYKLPNNKYAPDGCYLLSNGMELISEPKELTNEAWLAINCFVEDDAE